MFGDCKHDDKPWTVKKSAFKLSNLQGKGLHSHLDALFCCTYSVILKIEVMLAVVIYTFTFVVIFICTMVVICICAILRCYWSPIGSHRKRL